MGLVFASSCCGNRCRTMAAEKTCFEVHKANRLYGTSEQSLAKHFDIGQRKERHGIQYL